MSDRSPQALQRQSDDIQARYQFAFAGKPRITRDISMLDAIIRDAQTLFAKVPTGPSHATVRKLVQDRLKLYRDERQTIAQMQAQGPDARRAAVVATRANFVFASYRRNFAGQQRATRDLAMLDDMTSTLEVIADELQGLSARGAGNAANDLTVVRNNLEMYRKEREEIVTAQGAGSAEEQASALAGIANGQFELYRVNFAGQQRLTRRPALISRIIETLEGVLERMVQLERDGLTQEFNTRNQSVVTERLELYRRESQAIAEVRERTTPEELIDALGRDANAIFDEYQKSFAGKDRREVPLDVMFQLCERLGEIERQMNDLERAYDDATNSRNLWIVQDALIVYNREYDLIREARAH